MPISSADDDDGGEKLRCRVAPCTTARPIHDFSGASKPERSRFQAARPWGVWWRSAGYCWATCANWWWWPCAWMWGWTTAVGGVTVLEAAAAWVGRGVWGWGAWSVWLWPVTRLAWPPEWPVPFAVPVPVPVVVPVAVPVPFPTQPFVEPWLWWWWPKTTPEKATGHWWCFAEPFAWCACATTWWLEGGACAALGWWWLPVAPWWFALLALLLLLFCCCDCRWLFFLFFMRRFWNQIFTCRSVRFRLRASSHRFCFDTYALNRNSFSSSSVWNLEYGLRFFRTVTWPVHSRGFELPQPTPIPGTPTPTPTPAREPAGNNEDGEEPHIT